MYLPRQPHHRSGAFQPSAASALDTGDIHIGIASDRNHSNRNLNTAANADASSTSGGSLISESLTEALPFSHDDAAALIAAHRRIYDRLWSIMWRGARQRLAAVLTVLLMAAESDSCDSTHGNGSAAATVETDADDDTDSSFAERWGKALASGNGNVDYAANADYNSNANANCTVSIPRLLEALLRWRGDEYRIFDAIGACSVFPDVNVYGSLCSRIILIIKIFFWSFFEICIKTATKKLSIRTTESSTHDANDDDDDEKERQIGPRATSLIARIFVAATLQRRTKREASTVMVFCLLAFWLVFYFQFSDMFIFHI